MTSREQLQQEFVSLRNAQFKRPSTSNRRQYNLYLDWLNDSDVLAELKTDEQLLEAIKGMKGN